jgi:hypothetical protein
MSKNEFTQWKEKKTLKGTEDGSPQTPEREIRDDEVARQESEEKFKNKKGEASISIDEVLDSETENIEDLILEDIDANRPIEEGYGLEDDSSEKEFEDKGVYVSRNKNYIPFEIWKIKKKYSLPGGDWKKLSKDEQLQLKKRAQKEIEELYIKKSDQVNNQEKKKAA